MPPERPHCPSERVLRLLVPLLFVVYILNGGILRPGTTRGAGDGA